MIMDTLNLPGNLMSDSFRKVGLLSDGLDINTNRNWERIRCKQQPCFGILTVNLHHHHKSLHMLYIFQRLLQPR